MLKALSILLAIVFVAGIVYLFIGFAAFSLIWKIIYIALLIGLGAGVIALIRKAIRSIK